MDWEPFKVAATFLMVLLPAIGAHFLYRSQERKAGASKSQVVNDAAAGVVLASGSAEGFVAAMAALTSSINRVATMIEQRWQTEANEAEIQRRVEREIADRLHRERSER